MTPAPAPAPVLAAPADGWLWWDWVGRNGDDITAALREHVELTAAALLLGALIALPLAVVASRRRWLERPLLALTGVFYSVPSLALFAVLVPVTGLTRTTALIPLTAYTLLILVRNTLAGLDAVPPAVLDAADGMGYRPLRRLLSVELPLALPSILAGVRIALVTTVGLVTITVVIGYGGLGELIRDGQDRAFKTPIVVGAGLAILLSIGGDLLLAGLQRALTPWARSGRRLAPAERRPAVDLAA